MKGSLIDKVILEWGYRCENGYPNIDNEKDLKLFERLFNINLKKVMKRPYSYLNEESKVVANTIRKHLDISEDQIKASTKSKIVILSDEPRSEVFSKLEELGYAKNRILSGSSAGGYEAPNGTSILCKPLTLNEAGGTGVKNEKEFTEGVIKALKECTVLTVEVEPEKGPKLTFTNITGVKHIGKEGEKVGWKGDAALIQEDGTNIHISIKKDGPFRWGSVMTRYKDLYELFITKAKKGEIPRLSLRRDVENHRLLRMINTKTGKPYGRILIKNFTPLENDLQELIFGKDSAVVVQSNFDKNSFNLDLEQKILKVKVSRVIENLGDLEAGDRPIIEFERNASKANKLKGEYGRGIIMRVVPIERFLNSSKRANNLVIDYKDLTG